DAAGNPIRIVGTVVDVTERHTAYALLESNASRDVLTGLGNRLQLHDLLAAICSRSVEHSSRAAILILGLDGFKRFNDTLGHSAGDLLLQSVATRLSELFHNADLIARSGGDELVIVLNGAAATDAVAAACKIIYALAKPLEVAGRDLAVSASIGV